MALIDLNKIFGEITGMLGDLVFRHRPDGKLIVSSKPQYKGKRRHKGTPAQRAHRQRVSDIAPYASHLAKTHPIYAELAAEDKARGKWMSPYNFALADCLVSPVIHRIERAEGCIWVQATDNIGVVLVRVTVRDENGKILESDDAIRAEGDWWEFRTQAEGMTIVAQAWDIPRNMGKLVLEQGQPV
jgi:hypothetical protein